MTLSRDYCLKRLSEIVEGRLENSNDDSMHSVSRVPSHVAEELIKVYDEFLFSLWLSMGDTAFNKLGYRNATDDLLEQLKQRI